MIERRYITEATSETEIRVTPDGTFTRYRDSHRDTNHVDAGTGRPVKGCWSPWFSEASAQYTPERTLLAS